MISQYEYDNNDMKYDDDDMEYNDDINSQYEYNDDDMIVFDGYEEDDENDEDDEDENEENEEEGKGEGKRRGKEEEKEKTEERGENHHHQIVYEAFDKDKMSSYNGDGEFAPYFENFTTTSFFCWLQKHNISTTRPISISLKKAPSISKSIKNAYQLSIRDIIWYVLNNPSILKNMYFGLGIDSEINQNIGMHPSDYITLSSSSPSLPVYKLFIDLYFDDFGTYQNVYHSLGEFKQGKLIKVNGQDAWVIASLGVITADLPQGNDMADLQKTSRYHHVTDDQFKEILQESSASAKKHLCL
ncbi:hypothetical protein C1646_767422 [Rhizophagus diaphanus]|nr:hypothetical protein C1646_767422 [Rhizophagus diaphanus] [Rhizophagus sp. MUCL 43196]